MLIYIFINIYVLCPNGRKIGGVWEQRAEESYWDLQRQKVTRGIKWGD